MTVGGIFMVMVLLAFTRIPYDVHRWLGYAESEYRFTPEYLILLGGSGMPSESNLIRLYYLQNLAAKFPNAKIILTHPSDTAVVEEMALFLEKMDVKKERIQMMLNGTNTRSQASELKSGFAHLEKKKIVLVTSPENMFRTLKTFRKLHYQSVGGEPAYEYAMYVDLSYDSKKVGEKYYVPDVSSSMSLRYDFWNYMKLEVTCLREFAAIAYYKLNGWI
ncbi:MAG TPA: YdcF family protein [Bacteroidia bacterium]|nr:YdcF family protein [Bacteroidia bacterium]